MIVMVKMLIIYTKLRVGLMPNWSCYVFDGLFGFDTVLAILV